MPRVLGVAIVNVSALVPRPAYLHSRRRLPDNGRIQLPGSPAPGHALHDLHRRRSPVMIATFPRGERLR